MEPREWAIFIAGSLLEYDRSRLKEIHDELIQSHGKMTGIFSGFLFGGKFHSNFPVQKHFTLHKTTLHPAFHAQARSYMEEVRLADREEMQIRQGLFSLLQHCTCDQDIRDALPEALVRPIPELASYSRTRPEAYPILHSEIQMHNWKHISDVIFTRFASALI